MMPQTQTSDERSIAPSIHPDVTPEMKALLRAGAETRNGMVCPPSQVVKNYPALREAERLGFIRFAGVEWPSITDAGRAAIGAPSESEADRANRIALVAPALRRRALEPAKRDDPRTGFDYRAYRTMGYVCVLAVRLPDRRDNPQTHKVAPVGSNEPQYFGARNSIVQPESNGRFVLAVIPRWLQKVAKFSTYPMPLPEGDAWTADDRAAWDHLRGVCFSVNSRIRCAGQRARQSLRYGETA